MRCLIPIAALALLVCGAGAAEDCNGNGTPDAEDVASGASEDCNRDGRPDECDPPGADFDLVMEARVELGRVAAIAAADHDGDARPAVAPAPRD
jgi:hypothetical protein